MDRRDALKKGLMGAGALALPVAVEAHDDVPAGFVVLTNVTGGNSSRPPGRMVIRASRLRCPLPDIAGSKVWVAPDGGYLLVAESPDEVLRRILATGVSMPSLGEAEAQGAYEAVIRKAKALLLLESRKG